MQHKTISTKPRENKLESERTHHSPRILFIHSAPVKNSREKKEDVKKLSQLLVETDDKTFEFSSMVFYAEDKYFVTEQEEMKHENNSKKENPSDTKVMEGALEASKTRKK